MIIFEKIILFFILIVSAILDIRYRKTSDGLILLGIMIRGLFLWADGFMINEVGDTLVGGFGITIPLILTIVLIEKIMNKQIMGGGDVKLIFLCGLYLHFDKTLTALFIALLSILPVAIYDLIKKRDKLYPFVPSITFGVIVTVLLPSAIEVYNLSGQIGWCF